MDESKEVPVPTAGSRDKGPAADKKDVKIIVDKEDRGKEVKGKKKQAKEKAAATRAGASQSSSAALEPKEKAGDSSLLSPEQALKMPETKGLASAGGSSNLGVSVASALSEETPSPVIPPTVVEKPSLAAKREASEERKRAAEEAYRSADEDDADLDQADEGQYQEVTVPGQVYRELFAQFPPNPLLPKSFHAKDDSPRSGGVYKFMKLTRFRGADGGRSKFREEASKIEKIEFPEGVTMKKIFKVIKQEPEEPVTTGAQGAGTAGEGTQSRRPAELTSFGELVYLRNGNKDFLGGPKGAAQEGRDEVLDENLLDVKNLLKNATSSQAAHGKQPGQKALVNMQGIEAYYAKKDRFDKTLVFESRFESGNLAAALKVSDTDYHLALQNDVNTSGNTQWFFFRVSSTPAFTAVRFNLLNLCKPDSLYNEGMKVLVYSEKHAEAKDIGWHRGGSKIAYYANGIRKDGVKGFRTLYTMTFTYEFDYEDDTVYFAYCYPYTYTELAEELNAIIADPIKQQYVHKKTLTETLAGNKCEVLTITSKQNPENMAKRKGVILTARVHPGESVGSWMMKGALDFLVDPESIEAEYLRQHFVFKVVPMLNPDGVINGNYRCSLAGCDLNRRWKRPSKVLHPTIFATKQLCHQFSKERELQIFCDFHGHSRRKNIFMYGCNVPGQPEDTRLFPFAMSQICPFFVYNYSRFGNQRSKEATARMALFNELKCPAIYTIEASFCGNDMGPWKNYHFSTNNLMQTGRDFCRTLLLYLPIQVPKAIVSTFMQNINELYNHYKIISDSKIKPDPEVENMAHYFERLEKVKAAGKDVQTKHVKKGLAAVLRQTADIFTEGRSSSSAGSDKAPSEDNLDLEEIEKVLPVQEDPDLASKLQRTKTLRAEELKRDAEAAAAAHSANPPIKRSQTVGAAGLRKRASRLVPGTALKARKAKLDLAQKIDEEDVNDADDEGNGPDKTPASKGKQSEKEEEKDKVCELRDPETGNIIHKKRRRKNVESRDVSTQTERSDYMLIKQRQEEKKKQAAALEEQEREKAEGGPASTQGGDGDSAMAQMSLDMRNNPSTMQPAFQGAGGGFTQALNQQLLRKDLKSIMGENRDSAVTQKLLEEYLNRQKQGLVENILSQYNNQQHQGSPTGKAASGGVTFSNFVLQNQAQSVGNNAAQSMLSHMHDELNQETSPLTKGSEVSHAGGFSQAAQAAASSPSKKHRNLIQTRTGAAAYQHNPSANGQAPSSQQQNYSYPVAQGQRQLVSGQGQPAQNNFFGTGGPSSSQAQRAGMSTAYSVQGGRASSKTHGAPANQSRLQLGYSQGGTEKDQARNPLLASTQGSNRNLQAAAGQIGARPTQPQQKKQASTHWQKVSTNNHELTRLFYQLPGGTKSLVSNAIKSQNTKQGLKYPQNPKATRKSSQMDKRQGQGFLMGTPEGGANRNNQPYTANTMTSGASGTELPEQNAFQGQPAKTPGPPGSKSLKKYGQVGGYPGNTGPSKHISPQPTAQAEFLTPDKQAMSVAHASKKASFQNDITIKQSHTSKKPPARSRAHPHGPSQGPPRGGAASRQNPPQSANISRSTTWQQARNAPPASQQPRAGAQVPADGALIQDNYDFQLSMNKGAPGHFGQLVPHQDPSLQSGSASLNQLKHFEKRLTSMPIGSALGPQEPGQNPGLPPNTVQTPSAQPNSMQKRPQGSAYGVPSSTEGAAFADQSQPLSSNTFSNVYLGQALAAAEGLGHGAGSYQSNKMRYAGDIAAGLREPQSADNIIQGMQGEIMENALIQQKLKNINGDLRDIEELGDEITAEIVKKLKSQQNNIGGQPLTFSQDLLPGTHGLGASSQINVYNNFQPQRPGVASQHGQRVQSSQNQHVNKSQLFDNTNPVSQLLAHGLQTPHVAPTKEQLAKNSRNSQHRIQTANQASNQNSRAQMNNQYFQNAPQPPGQPRDANGQQQYFYNQQKRNKFPENVQLKNSQGQTAQQQQIVNVHNQFNISNNIIINATPNHVKVSNKTQPLGVIDSRHAQTAQGIHINRKGQNQITTTQSHNLPKGLDGSNDPRSATSSHNRKY